MLKAAHLLDSIRGSRALAEERRRGRRSMAGSRMMAVEAEGSSPTRVPLGWVLALNLGMALLLGAGLGFLQANVGHLAAPIPPLAVALVGAGVMGLLFGLANRLMLRDRTGTLKFLLSLLPLLAWTAATEVTYAAWVGLHPLEYLSGADNWVEMGQLAIGCLSIVAVILIGRRTREWAPLQRVRGSGGQTSTSAGARFPLTWGLGLNLALAVVLGLGLGFLQANADQLAAPIPHLAVALGGAGVTGLLTGLTARLTLRGWSEGLKTAVTLLTLLLWLVVAEATYAAWMGLRPLEYLAGGDNWVEAGQLAVGCLAAIAGGVGRRRVDTIRTDAVEVGPAAQRRRRIFGRPRWVISLSRLRWPALTFRRPRPAKNNSQVKVTGNAQDRCPYCLDVVEKKDPRGVVVCEICGTPHHADCWEAGGGKCQVPHLIT